MYNCYLNGQLYGVGSLDYMLELFKNYVVTCEMYGMDTVSFTIEKR